MQYTVEYIPDKVIITEIEADNMFHALNVAKEECPLGYKLNQIYNDQTIEE